MTGHAPFSGHAPWRRTAERGAMDEGAPLPREAHSGEEDSANPSRLRRGRLVQRRKWKRGQLNGSFSQPLVSRAGQVRASFARSKDGGVSCFRCCGKGIPSILDALCPAASGCPDFPPLPRLPEPSGLFLPRAASSFPGALCGDACKSPARVFPRPAQSFLTSGEKIRLLDENTSGKACGDLGREERRF